MTNAELNEIEAEVDRISAEMDWRDDNLEWQWWEWANARLNYLLETVEKSKKETRRAVIGLRLVSS